MASYATHQDAANAHTAKFTSLLITSETLKKQYNKVLSQLNATAADSTDERAAAWEQLDILNIEIWEAYTEAQLHLLAADKHSQSAKSKDTSIGDKVVPQYY